MPTDNALYDRLADSWWDPQGVLHILQAYNPVRFGYMRRVLRAELGGPPDGLRALDVGCGGGLLAEEFARIGLDVTGVDPSAASLAAARAHATREGLPIRYERATGEALPFADGIFDVVYCCDVLEHVEDLSAVVTESARVLKPGGLYLFDTINRTLRSRLVVIHLLQEWRWTRLLPPRLHDWRMFIRPAELRALLEQHDLSLGGLTGLKPRATPVRILRALRQRRRGRLSYAEAFARLNVGESTDLSLSYIGYARKAAGAVRS